MINAVMLLYYLLALLTISDSATPTTVYYRFHEDNDASVNECLLNAMDTLMEETCVVFEPTTDDAVVFMQSGHCSWQESNSTVHMAPECTDEEACYLVLSHVLSIQTPVHHSHISRLVNLKYNCTDRCTTVCENGGTVSSSCSCLCGYGFTGDRCQYLSKQHLFNDASCGIVNTSQVSLSAYPQPTRGPIFCQWLIRAPEANTIEFSIQDLDLDAEKVLQNQPCNDMFYIWGSKDISNPIPCNSESLESLIGKALKSDSNWLLIELRMNPWSEVAHKGPLIKFRYVTPSSLKVLRAYTSEMSLMSSSTIAPLPAATILLVILCIVFFPQQH